MGNEAAIENEFLGLVEGFNLWFFKGVPFTLHGEVGKRVNDLAEVLQETSIKVAEPKE